MSVDDSRTQRTRLVLLVSEDADDGAAIAAALEADLSFARVVRAGSRLVALRWLESVRPTLILLDLPSEAHLDVCRQVKENPAFARVPVVLVQSADESAGRSASGCDAVLTRPFEPGALREIARRWLEPVDAAL